MVVVVVVVLDGEDQQSALHYTLSFLPLILFPRTGQKKGEEREREEKWKIGSIFVLRNTTVLLLVL